MSRLTDLLKMVRSLPPTPLRPANSAQLADGFESIITRAFPIPTTTSTSSETPTPTMSTGAIDSALSSNLVQRTLGPSEERAAEEMSLAIERIKSNYALHQVSSLTSRPGNGEPWLISWSTCSTR